MKLEFSRNFFSKNTQISNLKKIRPAGAELFHADRRMDGRDEANSRSSQFCERAKKGESPIQCSPTSEKSTAF